MYVIIITPLSGDPSYMLRDEQKKVLQFSSAFDAGVYAIQKFASFPVAWDVQYRPAATRRGGKPAR